MVLAEVIRQRSAAIDGMDGPIDACRAIRCEQGGDASGCGDQGILDGQGLGLVGLRGCSRDRSLPALHVDEERKMLRDDRMSALAKSCMCRAALQSGRLPPFTSVMPRLREASEQPKRTEALSGKAVHGQAWRNLVSGAEH
jgi:hypothetical protein